MRISAKITAWNSDSTHAGYEILKSNGRIESDLLDRLQESLSSAPGMEIDSSTGKANASEKSSPAAARAPEISAPMPQLPDRFGVPRVTGEPIAATTDSGLEQEARNLEEILRNQSHPTNLIAVKLDKSPVLQSPSSNSKVLFLANVEDEFEILDLNPEWIHVRISGLSRGWLRRSAVEILDGSEPSGDASSQNTPSAQEAPLTPVSATAAPFSVSSEELGSFPGDWPQLRGRNVKIISIQQAPGTGRITSPHDKLVYAEGLFRKNDPALAQAAGLVLIFDSEDGGMIAAPTSALDQWRRGAISDQVFWKQCLLDPPEILGSVN